MYKLTKFTIASALLGAMAQAGQELSVEWTDEDSKMLRALEKDPIPYPFDPNCGCDGWWMVDFCENLCDTWQEYDSTHCCKECDCPKPPRPHESVKDEKRNLL